MSAGSTRRRVGRVVLGLVLCTAGMLAVPGPANAAPWGTDGADYDGVLCHLDGTTDVPMGAWTVNGTVRAFSTADVTGSGAAQQPAPVSGSPSQLAPGQAGLGSDSIAALAYLLTAHQDGSAAELAEVSADVARTAGGGQAQQRCLGQNGTSAAGARALLDEARRYAGPYTVDVRAQQDAIPGADASIAVTVRSAAGVGTPGLDVSITAGGSVVNATTGRNGVARTSVVMPAAASTPVTATASVPSGLVYLDTTPASISAAPPTTVTGTGALQPVLHPRPMVTVSSDELALAGGTLRPKLGVTGTFGYSGTGAVVLHGPVQAASCSRVPTATLTAAPAAWQQAFTFQGDATLQADPTSTLTAGCYALQATVTTTNSSPPEQAASPVVPVTVTSLQVAVKPAGPAAAPGGLAAVVTGTTPATASVRTTLVARGPLRIGNGRCSGNFADAPEAGISPATTLERSGDALQARVTVPDVRAVGCYALVARSAISVDGRSTTVTSPDDGATMAVLRPALVVTADAASAEQGKSVPGHAALTGTFGFAGTIAAGVVQGQTVPITGCRDARFAAGEAPTRTSSVRTKGDMSYAFRAPATTHNACYAVVATFTLTGNAAVHTTPGAPSTSTIFLAGVRPDPDVGSVVQHPGSRSIARPVVAYAIFALLLLIGCVTLFARTLADERDVLGAGRVWRWLPNRRDDAARPPRPGTAPTGLFSP